MNSKVRISPITSLSKPTRWLCIDDLGTSIKDAETLPIYMKHRVESGDIITVTGDLRIGDLS